MFFSALSLKTLPSTAAAFILAACPIFGVHNKNNCKFAYYKEFRHPGDDTEEPPVTVDCRIPHLWRNGYCPETNRGVEMDWMSYFWSWHTRDDYGADEEASMAQIYDVLDKATDSGGSTITWSNIRQAAQDKWGTDTPEYDNFFLWANAHGVRD